MTDISATPAQRAILDHLKRNGPAEAVGLADELGVTTMAVRQHLNALEAAGLVSTEETDRSGARGRPSRQWKLTPKADTYFSDAHAELSVELIANVRDVFGEQGLTRLIAKRTSQQISAYRADLASATSLREKVRRLVKLRTDAGYLAELQVAPDGFLLIENHCPICRAARACTGLCRQELEVFQAALGRDVLIERTEHILAGARRCAYHIRQKVD
jgi:predicted ArsR family transcriptional regulator